mmetsp:Transcript_30731/g.60410  ORF Transcript_30731/g.60410 Transcript_30731/m.60410 type:complete len:96 (-) Transcript_30731:674-961(-)
MSCFYNELEIQLCVVALYTDSSKSDIDTTPSDTGHSSAMVPSHMASRSIGTTPSVIQHPLYSCSTWRDNSQAKKNSWPSFVTKVSWKVALALCKS